MSKPIHTLTNQSGELFRKIYSAISLKGVRRGAFISAFLFVFIIVIFTAWQHEPYFSFDESNTIRIASYPPQTITRLLSYEQNFPAYYILIHGMMSVLDDYVHAIILVQLLVWGGSIIVFFLITKYIRVSFNYRLLFTLLFSLCSSVSYYAYYVRMYGLVLLLFLGIIWLSYKYTYSHNVRYIYSMLPVLFGIVVLHPSGLLIVVAQLLLVFLIVPYGSVRIVYTVCSAGILGAGILLLHKNRQLYEIYVEGVRYANEAQMNYHEIPQHLFFSAESQFDWLVFMVVCGSFYIFIANRLWRNTEGILLSAYGCIFFIITLVTRGVYQPRHYIYFVPILLLIMLSSISYIRRKNVKAIIVIGLICIFTGSFVKFYINQTVLTVAYKYDCQQLSNLDSGIIITTVPYINILSYCITQDNQLYSISPTGLINVSSLSEEEVIQYQVTTGGEYITSLKKESYRNFLVERMNVYQNDLKMINAVHTHKNMYYIPSISSRSQSMYAEELELFVDYAYKGSPIVGVFMFTQN